MLHLSTRLPTDSIHQKENGFPKDTAAFKENSGIAGKKDPATKRKFGTELTNNASKITATRNETITAHKAPSAKIAAPAVVKRTRTVKKPIIRGIPIDPTAVPDDYQPPVSIAAKIPAELDVPLDLLVNPTRPSFDLLLEPSNKSTTLEFNTDGRLLGLDAIESPEEEVLPEDI